jgi:hypothetical protein
VFYIADVQAHVAIDRTTANLAGEEWPPEEQGRTAAAISADTVGGLLSIDKNGPQIQHRPSRRLHS